MRFIVLLLAILLFITSCKNDEPLPIDEVKISEPKWVMSDSITFKVELPAQGVLLLNLEDEYYDHILLEWENESDKDSVFTTVIPRYHKTQIIYYSHSVYDSIQKRWKFLGQNFIIDSLTNLVQMKVVDYKVELLNHDQVMSISEMGNAYENLRAKIYRWKGDDSRFKKPLDSLREHFNSVYKTEQSELNRKLNTLEYYDKLFDIDPKLVPLDSLMRHTDLMIARSAGPNLVYKYIHNNMDSIVFEFLSTSNNDESTENESETYERNLAIGVLRYLRYTDSKGNNLYPDARNWLKRTKYYKDNQVEIDSQIEAPNNEAFKNVLSELEIVDVNFKQSSITEIVKENPSQYYLIDLWATWCAPCINGMKLMDRMDIPNNIKVISLNTDYKKDKELWQTKSQELDLDINYMIVDKEDNKEFYKFINMKSIPRYLLIDSKLNLIDMAFYQPHEPNFINKLKDVKNHTRW